MNHSQQLGIKNKVLDTIITILSQVCAESSINSEIDEIKSFIVFNSKSRPDITIDSYLKRIKHHFELCDNALIAMMIYITKLSLKVTIKHSNVFKLILVAALAAAKYCYDEVYANSVYAKIGGISTEELGRIEAKFLEIIEFKLYIQEDLFNLYHQMFGNSIQKKVIYKRLKGKKVKNVNS